MKAFEVFEYPENETRFYDHLGIKEFGIDDDGVFYAVMPVKDCHKNGHGFCQGGALFSLCDIAAGAWARKVWHKAVTVDASIQYLSSGNVGSTLTAKVNPRKIGKRISTLLIEVYDNEGHHIVDATINMMSKE